MALFRGTREFKGVLQLGRSASTMAYRNLSNIPNDIVLIILSYLNESHRSSLRSVALVSRSLYLCAVEFLFRDISITLPGTDHRIEGDILKALYRLPPNVARCIKNLHIECRGPSRRIKSGLWGKEHYEPLGFYYNIEENFKHAKDLITKHSENSRPANYQYDLNQHEDNWRPLADFIALLGANRAIRLNWNYPRQLPRCVRMALEASPNSCTVYINIYQVARNSVHENDVDTATSPCLAGLTCGIHGAGLKIEQETYKIIQAIASGLAPNIQELCLYRQTLPYARSDEDYPYLPSAYVIERAFLQQRRDPLKNAAKASKGGKLQRLVLDGPSLGDVTRFLEWRDLIDISCLKTLQLTNTSIDEATFLELANNCTFSSLETLILWIGRVELPKPEAIAEHQAFCTFIRSLRPLEDIRIMADLRSDLLTATLNQHGATLVNLVLSLRPKSEFFAVSIHDVEAIAKSCPVLQSLSITIPRSKGDAAEVAIYRALGSIPQVRKLFLTLDASYIAPGIEYEEDGFREYENDLPNDPSFDSSEQRVFLRNEAPFWRFPRIGHLCNGLINAALDETLARAIFKAIESRTLDILQVDSIGACEFEPDRPYPIGFDQIIYQITRCWWLERNPRDDRRDDLMVEDVTPKTRLIPPEQKPLEVDVAEVVCKVWGDDACVGLDWTEVWHSFPLLGG
ncbi:hypothetical protein BT63DRAFT_419239 [Microthyrium microscopicum]|uniref:F-box domain-containing protein n=1 Tax=Microthyrium microscopicum TaxID=703497 RepID=A0A6A6TWZ7_9PEZI|nr:hypothetical protein BT63DRAFT_419239 [Microthyrium microscopicum]